MDDQRWSLARVALGLCPVWSWWLDIQNGGDFTNAPECSGKPISGSGGHIRHLYCGEVATWWDYDCTYAYCDEHIPKHERIEYLSWWIDEGRF